MPYSSSALSGLMLTAQTFSATGATLGPIGGTPSITLSRSLALHIATSTRLPLAASASASAAHTVVFPTPPLPVTRTKRLSASVDMRGDETHSTSVRGKARCRETVTSLQILPLGGLGEIGM